MARIISIVNQKGGTGKSACTANLAVGLAQKNMKVLIVDADPQSDVSAGFGYRDCDDSNETLTVLMDAVMKDEDIPSDCYIRHQAEGIDIICSNIGLAGTEVQLVNAMSREYVLKQILYGIKDQYDAIIIDCMPSLGMITINALAASDEVLIPVEASYLPIKGLQQLLKTIGKVRKQINPKLQVGGILFTMVDAHTNDARNNMELLRNVYGSQIHIFDNYIPFSVRMKEAVREGQSIFSYDPKGKATIGGYWESTGRSDIGDTYDSVLSILQLGLLVTSLLLLFVSVLGQINIGLSSLEQRTHELLIRRAIGASRTNIVALVLGSQLILSIFVCFAAILISLILVHCIGVLLPVDSPVGTPSYPISVAVVAVAVSVLTALLGGLLPALKAAKLEPALALR
mgnify:CR=1 FL=1